MLTGSRRSGHADCQEVPSQDMHDRSEWVPMHAAVLLKIPPSRIAESADAGTKVSRNQVVAPVECCDRENLSQLTSSMRGDSY